MCLVSHSWLVTSLKCKPKLLEVKSRMYSTTKNVPMDEGAEVRPDWTPARGIAYAATLRPHNDSTIQCFPKCAPQVTYMTSPLVLHSPRSSLGFKNQSPFQTYWLSVSGEMYLPKLPRDSCREPTPFVVPVYRWQMWGPMEIQYLV